MLFVFMMVMASCKDDDDDNGSATDPSAPTETTLPPGAMVSESLKDGQTVGAVQDGDFTTEGLQLHGDEGYIRYSIPQTPRGYIEFSARGFNPQAAYADDKVLIVAMWSGDHGYDYDHSPFLLEFRKTGAVHDQWHLTDNVHLRGRVPDAGWVHGEWYPLSWDQNQTYRFRLEWTDGQIVVYRDGQATTSMSFPGTFSPTNHLIQIGANFEALRANWWKETHPDLLISDVVIGSL
jgi:hypothetical protein